MTRILCKLLPMPLPALSLALLVLLVASSCSTPSAPEFNEEHVQYLNELSRGWEFFSAGENQLAATSFRRAIAINIAKDRPEAYLGLGWSLAMQDSLPHAISNFNLANARQIDNAEDRAILLAGFSLVSRDLVPPDFTAARDNAEALLELDPNFILEYRTTVNAADIRAVLAEAYFNLEQLEEAADLADPQGTLDPADEEYSASLLQLINLLLESSRGGE